jgi:hypothetical protein
MGTYLDTKGLAEGKIQQLTSVQVDDALVLNELRCSP